MSHIPASAMPHAAPHHHDPEAAPADGAAMSMEPTATAATSDAPPAEAPAAPEPTQAAASSAPPRSEPPAARQDAKPARSNRTLALVIGGVAAVAGFVAVVAPRLRSSDGKQRKREA